ncbi:MAG: metallophosphoesterase [Myxococcota bacterium]
MVIPPAPSPLVFGACSLGVALVVAALGFRFRSRTYATFRLVLFVILIPIATALYRGAQASLGAEVGWIFVFLQGTSFLQSLALIRPRMRSLAYRLVVSWPSSVYDAGTLLGLIWALLSLVGLAFDWIPPLWWSSFALAAVGLGQSLARRRDTYVLALDGEAAPGEQPVRWPWTTGDQTPSPRRPLRIAQLTDTHLGPFMSERSLAANVRRAVERKPDLIALTGDFLTMESQADPGHLTRALAPLRDFDGPVVACFGNHDYEAPETVKSALAENGVRLLMDEATVLETPAGSVQVLGAEFAFRDREERLRALSAAHPRLEGHLRLWLLHDPGAFRYLADGDADLVLSGHTHGGQVGFVSLGAKGTIVSWVTSMPDHGYWARGQNRLWVHRGTGHYGFPLRLGVPREESLLLVCSAG